MDRVLSIVKGCAYEPLPHVIEPAYPGAVAHYLNLAAFYDKEALRARAGDLIALKEAYQSHYRRAYQYLRAAREVRRNEEKAVLTEEALAKITKRAKGILSREVKRKKLSQGRERQAFLGAITCRGELCLYETLQSSCKRIYEIQDHAALGHALLAQLREGILAAGYDIISYLSPEDPSRLAHLEIPSLSLAFACVQTGERALPKRPYRRLRMETMLASEQIKANRTKLRFATRIAAELQADAVLELQAAKALHDEMEDFYQPHVDFTGVDRMTADLLAEIAALP